MTGSGSLCSGLARCCPIIGQRVCKGCRQSGTRIFKCLLHFNKRHFASPILGVCVSIWPRPGMGSVSLAKQHLMGWKTSVAERTATNGDPDVIHPVSSSCPACP